MWIIAGVLLGITLLASLVGFHAGPHVHLAGGLVGLVAAGWLVAMVATGQPSAVVYVLLGADVALSAGIGIGGRRALALRGIPRAHGPGRLEGVEGIAVNELSPEGIVRVRGEEWSARSLNGPIEAGSVIQVIRADGVRLEVWGDTIGGSR